MDRFIYVTENMLGETGETVDDCVDTMRRYVDKGGSPEHVRPMAARFALLVHHDGAPKGWTTNASGEVDCYHKADARQAAIYQFLDAIRGLHASATMPITRS